MLRGRRRKYLRKSPCVWSAKMDYCEGMDSRYCPSFLQRTSLDFAFAGRLLCHLWSPSSSTPIHCAHPHPLYQTLCPPVSAVPSPVPTLILVSGGLTTGRCRVPTNNSVSSSAECSSAECSSAVSSSPGSGSRLRIKGDNGSPQ
jgi:hypothetical protein